MCVPRRVRIYITVRGILDLAHGGAATESATEIGAAAASRHDVHDEGGDEGDETEPQEGSGGLGLTTVLCCVGRAVGYAVGAGVALMDS